MSGKQPPITTSGLSASLQSSATERDNAGPLFFSYPAPDHHPDDPFFKPLQKAGLPTIQKAPANTPSPAPAFKVITTGPQHFPITQRVYPAGLTFSIGGGGGPEMKHGDTVFPAEPHLFSWDATVQAEAPPETLNEWVVGMLQSVNAWYVDVIWGPASNNVRCTGRFNKLHDGFDESKAWFQGEPASFSPNGISQPISIKDSPVLQIPFINPKTASEAWGYFDYYAAFTTYISAFHLTQQASNPAAYTHIAAVNWQVRVAGNFDGRNPVQPEIIVKEGGTTVDKVQPGTAVPPPVLEGRLAIDEIAAILNCWTK